MATVLSTPNQRVMMYDISWETYERLLVDFAESSAPRLTYDRGTLEIISPLPDHEKYNRTINLLVEEVADSLGLDVENLGSTTFKREDLAKGFKPDSCFYVQNAERVRGKSQLELSVDPPPDLVIEIDPPTAWAPASSSLPKLPIYAQLGIPEVWRYNGKEMTLLLLEEGVYREGQESRALPRLTRSDLTQFLEDSKTLKRTEWRRKLREWLRSREK
jgi:Uma2 family endonuclease